MSVLEYVNMKALEHFYYMHDPCSPLHSPLITYFLR